MKPTLPTWRDLRGAARLATDATLGVTGVVEAMHARIARLPVGTAPAQADGISGLVYRSVRGVTRAVGASVDAAFSLLPAAEMGAAPSRQREAMVAALNGVFGDHLAATGNPLATAMAFCHDGRPLAIEREALAAALPGAGDSLLLLIHGLCMNDLQWRREAHGPGVARPAEAHDHGSALARDLGFTPLYLRYNSGLHIAANGRELAVRIERLLDEWPQALRRFTIIGHSMGGLLARSAIHHAQRAGLRWPDRLTELMCLGTPHHGAPLERAGHGLDRLLAALPYAAPLARLGQARSAGITDLRHGRLTDDDSAAAAGGGPVPLPPGVRCFAAAATLGAVDDGLKTRLLGDGLVPLDSALGRHADPQRTLAFGAERQWVGHGIGHLQLLDEAAVYPQLLRWLSAPEQPAPATGI